MSRRPPKSALFPYTPLFRSVRGPLATMLQTLIITLREGVEAALVVAIAIAYLRKIGRRDLLPAVHRAFGSAVIASFGFAWLLSRLGLGEDSYEGWTLLVSAVFVLSMVLWMNRH